MSLKGSQSERRPLRVIVAEDSLFVRQGLLGLLTASGMEVVGDFGDAEALVTAVETDPPDVVITDIKMPPTFTDEGLEAAEAIKESHPEVGVLVLSQYVEPRYAAKLLTRGGVGYLLKERVAKEDDFTDAVIRVDKGESVIDPELVDRLLQKRRRNSALDLLSERELEILRQMAEGRSNEGICHTLFLSPKTVETHIRNIFNKLSLPPDCGDHRRVLAVVDYLRA